MKGVPFENLRMSGDAFERMHLSGPQKRWGDW
jgi:hypothetical protein